MIASSDDAVRVERDSLGQVDVPAAALYGAHTQRAVENFGPGGPRLADEPDLIRALAEVKIAAAIANRQLGVLRDEIADAVIAAAREVASGLWNAEFPMAFVHGGGGTAANMNANEVIANRAAEILGGERGTYERVHPNDHVNRSQSTNDVYPTALQIACRRRAVGTIEAFGEVERVLADKAREAGDMLRLGRTCLQDALPLTVSDTHLAQRAAVVRTVNDLRRAVTELEAVPLGATAVGTGLGTPAGYTDLAIQALVEETGLPLRRSENPYDALAHPDAYLAVASALTRCMLVLAKMAADIRLLSSGPKAGIGELTLPAVQVGSSQMPGKVNPVIPELVLQTSYEIRAAAYCIEAALADGELELNVMEPVIGKQLLQALSDAERVARLFASRCLAGLRWNQGVLREHVAGSFADAVELAARDGYEAAAVSRMGAARDSANER
jgi:aspartate ammonia-lyase